MMAFLSSSLARNKKNRPKKKLGQEKSKVSAYRIVYAEIVGQDPPGEDLEHRFPAANKRRAGEYYHDFREKEEEALRDHPGRRIVWRGLFRFVRGGKRVKIM